MKYVSLLVFIVVSPRLVCNLIYMVLIVQITLISEYNIRNQLLSG